MLNKKLITGLLMTVVATVAIACGSDGPASEPTPTPTPAEGQETVTPVVPTPTSPPATPTPSQPDIQAQLDGAIARWNASRPANYRISVDRLCFCPPEDPVVITVHGTEVVSSTGGPQSGVPMTVETFFERIQTALDSEQARILAVEFERDLGYPISVSIDNIVNAIDDEVSYTIREFRILPEEVDFAQLKRDLDAATLLWFESGPQSYEFVFRWQCFCPPEANSPVRVRVEGGRIVSTVDARSGDPVVAPGGLEYQTVASLFGWISQRLNNAPEFAALEFDAETGYPISAQFNPILEVVDEEEAFFIEELTVLDLHGELQTELDAARALWASAGFTDYTYRFNWQCFCLQEYVAPMTVTVENGEVTSVIRVEDGQPVDKQFSDDFETVDALFDRLQDAIDQGAASIRAEFDAVNGLPTEVFIDFQVILADEELGWNAGVVASLG